MENKTNRMLTQVHEGMMVYGPDGERIGKVEYVHFGEEDPTRPGPETVTGSETLSPNPLAEVIHDLFDPDELPEQLRAHLLRYGFIRIETGLLREDRYATPDQIVNVTEDRVDLNTTRDELITE